jgi:hypothetical protein
LNGVNLLAALPRSAVSRLALGRVLVLLAIATVAAACASASPGASGLRGDEPLAGRVFSFDRDTFAFRNDIRALSPERDDLYANYCFVVAKGLRQFFMFARFDPTAARLDHQGYVERVRRVVSHQPWRATLAPDDRVVIPGYASLREFSRAEESAVKEGLGGRFWTLVHWTNWRVVFPMPRPHQAHVLEEILGELASGRLVQLLITNWPVLELNHTVVAFASRANGTGVELTIWDPNEPERAGTITFDSVHRQFWATRVYATRPGAIRVFRMYQSALL